MNLQFYFEKLLNSEEFAEFKKENPNAFLCSGFFAIDKKGKDNQQHFDYFIDGKIFSFQIEKGCVAVPIEAVDKRVPEKIEDNLDVDFEYVEKIVQGEMWEQGIKKEIEKYLLSLQKFEGVNYLVGTIFISGMGMIKIKIDADEMKLIDFEKKSFMDFFKVVKKNGK